jgi:hypothetical protein
MNKMCGMSIAGIFMLLLLFFVPNNKAEAQAKLPDSVRFLSREKIQAIMDLSTYGPLDEGRPDYPVIMRGWRLSFDQPWLSFIFDHPVLWFVEEAAVASAIRSASGPAQVPSGLRHASPSCLPGVLMVRCAYWFKLEPSCFPSVYACCAST